MGVVDDYLSAFSDETLNRLKQMRQTVGEEAPQAVEVMSYGIPTLDLRGWHVVHFAGFPHHIGFYPTPAGMAAFLNELADYPQGKGSVQFPHDRPLPLDLVRRIVRHQVAVVLSKPQKPLRSKNRLV